MVVVVLVVVVVAVVVPGVHQATHDQQTRTMNPSTSGSQGIICAATGVCPATGQEITRLRSPSTSGTRGILAADANRNGLLHVENLLADANASGHLRVGGDRFLIMDYEEG